jgi:hypothetical protein
MKKTEETDEMLRRGFEKELPISFLLEQNLSALPP